MAPKGAVFVILVMQCRMLDLLDFSLRSAMQGELLEALFLFSSVKPVNSKAGFQGADATRSSVTGLQN